MDRSIKYLRCLIENELVKVEKFIFSWFYYTRHNGGWGYPFDLGHIFSCHMENPNWCPMRELILMVEDEQVTFDTFKAMNFPYKVHSYF